MRHSRDRLLKAIATALACLCVALVGLLCVEFGISREAGRQLVSASAAREPISDRSVVAGAESGASAAGDAISMGASRAAESMAETEASDSSAATSSDDDPIVDEKIADEFIATVEGSPADAGLAVGESLAGATITEVAELGGGSVCVKVDDQARTASAIEELAARDGVSAQPNFVYRLMDVEPTAASDPNEVYEPNDAELENQYYLLPQDFFNRDKASGANVEAAWNLMRTEHTVTVATIDTGCDMTHPDLKDNLDKKHAIDMYASYPMAGMCYDVHGHGTHVAGIIAASVDNKIGTAGVSYNATVLPIKVFNNKGGASAGASTSTIVKAYDYLEGLINKGELKDLRVINMSLGGYGKSAEDLELEKRINRFYDTYQVLTVCAGGNGDSLTNTPYTDYSYPSDFDKSLSVTALDKTGCDLAWSDYNEMKDISAPGDRIRSTYLGDGYETMSGTSMASPLVAGIAALLYAADPELTAAEATAAIKETALVIPMTKAHGERVTGTRGGIVTGSAGAIDAEGAVRKVLRDRGITKFIEPKDVVVGADHTEYDNSKALEPTLTVTHDGKELEKTVEYTTSYRNNVKPGTASATVKGEGEWGGWVSKPFTITIQEKDRPPIANVHVDEVPAQTYNEGEAFTPPVHMSYNDMELVENEDYTLAYSNNREAGEASIEVTGIGIFKETRTVNFDIDPADGYLTMDEKGTTITLSPKTPAIDHTMLCPQGMSFYTECSVPNVVKAEAIDDYSNLENRKFHYLRITPIAPGETQVTVKAKSVDDYDGNRNYTTPADVTFTVKVLESNMDVASAEVTVAGGSVYTGSAIKPAVTVTMDGEPLRFADDYGLTWLNNTYAGNATVVVSGRGFYIGQTAKKFTIDKAETPLSVSPSSLTFTEGDTSVRTVAVSGAIGDLTLTNSNDGAATASLSNGNVVISPQAVGNTTITISCPGDGNHKEASRTIDVTVEKKAQPQVTPDPPKPGDSGSGGTGSGGSSGKDPGVTMYRLYNPNSGEHFYTASAGERESLRKAGWTYEGVGWVAPSSGQKVYRLYSGTDHHYTMSEGERRMLIRAGWRDEGVGWFSGGSVVLWRQFNPNVDPSAPRNNSGSHNYTTSTSERAFLVSHGWRDEGRAWYALRER